MWNLYRITITLLENRTKNFGKLFFSQAITDSGLASRWCLWQNVSTTCFGRSSKVVIEVVDHGLSLLFSKSFFCKWSLELNRGEKGYFKFPLKTSCKKETFFSLFSLLFYFLHSLSFSYPFPLFNSPLPKLATNALPSTRHKTIESPIKILSLCLFQVIPPIKRPIKEITCFLPNLLHYLINRRMSLLWSSFHFPFHSIFILFPSFASPLTFQIHLFNFRSFLCSNQFIWFSFSFSNFFYRVIPSHSLSTHLTQISFYALNILPLFIPLFKATIRL